MPTYPEIAADPQMEANDVFLEYEDPRWGRMRTVNDPIAVSGVAKVAPRPAPDSGQHTREVLVSLGYSDGEVASLLARGIAIQA